MLKSYIGQELVQNYVIRYKYVNVQMPRSDKVMFHGPELQIFYKQCPALIYISTIRIHNFNRFVVSKENVER